jgi:cytosine/adenosine deaminase-related metal-dependent hydrolase
MADVAHPSVDVVVGGGWVITVDAERRIFRKGAVAVAGERILAVDQFAEVTAQFPDAPVIDTSDMVVTPGLINTHRHLLATPKGAQPDGNLTLGNLSGFVYPAFAALTEEDMHVYTLHATAEMIRFGTTTFEEPGCEHLDSVLDALAISGIRCRVGPWTWDQLGPPEMSRNCPDWLNTSTADAIKRLEWGLEVVRDYGHPRISDAVTVEGVGTCSDELYVAAARLAAEADSLCVTHKSTSENEVRIELEYFGHRPVEHMYRIGALNEHVILNHVTSLDLFEVDYFVETGARISQNPSSALKLTKGTTQTGKWPELLAAGVPIGLGTDAENASNHADICRSMYLAALLPRDARRDPRAVSAEQAVEMATILGAKAIRMDDRIGSLEVGKQADLVAFDTRDFDWRPLHNPISNLVYGSTGYSVHTVMIGGEVVLDGGRHTRVDVGDVREAAERADRRILAEIGVDPKPAWPVL